MSIPQSKYSYLILTNSQLFSGFRHFELTLTIKKGLAIVTRLVTRIRPHAIVGTEAGDTKILRNYEACLTKTVARIRTYPLLQKGVFVAVTKHNDSTRPFEPIDC